MTPQTAIWSRKNVKYFCYQTLELKNKTQTKEMKILWKGGEFSLEMGHLLLLCLLLPGSMSCACPRETK